MVSYSLGFIFDHNLEHVLLVHKQRPTWQAGRINGVGGKVEAGETSIACMVRECREETGLSIPQARWQPIGSITETDATIELFTTTYPGDPVDATSNDHETVEWFTVTALPETVITNLHFLVPLACAVWRGHGPTHTTIQY